MFHNDGISSFAQDNSEKQKRRILKSLDATLKQVKKKEAQDMLEKEIEPDILVN